MVDITNCKILKVENRENGIQPAMFCLNETTNHIFMVTIAPEFKFYITDEGLVGQRYDLNGVWVCKD